MPDRSDRPFDIELRDTPMGPVDDAVRAPPTKERKALEHLRKLEYAPPFRAELSNGEFETVARALDRGRLTVDEANNLGCARAHLALRDGSPSSWEGAIEALTDAAEARGPVAGEAGGAESRARARRNLERVLDAWDALGART